jgi:hypothetical protein
VQEFRAKRVACMMVVMRENAARTRQPWTSMLRK